MALTEYQDLINDMKELLLELQEQKGNGKDLPLVVCLPGTNKAFFNIL